MHRYLSIVIACALLAIGFVKILASLSSVRKDLEFAVGFLNDFRLFCTGLWKGNPDHKLYEKLVMRSTSMQSRMGQFGYAEFTPPFSRATYRNYPIIINLIPQINRMARSSDFKHYDLVKEEVYHYISFVDDALLQYLGHLEDKGREAQKNLANPLIWLHEGASLVFQLPFLLLASTGVITEYFYRKISESSLVKLFGLLLALANFLSAITTVITGYDPLLKIIRSWFDVR